MSWIPDNLDRMLDEEANTAQGDAHAHRGGGAGESSNIAGESKNIAGESSNGGREVFQVRKNNNASSRLFVCTSIQLS